MASSLCHNRWGVSIFYIAILFLHKLPQVHCGGFSYPFDTCSLHSFIFVLYIHMDPIPTYPSYLRHLYIDTLLSLPTQYVQKQKAFSLPNKFLILTPPVLSVTKTRNHDISKNVACFQHSVSTSFPMVSSSMWPVRSTPALHLCWWSAKPSSHHLMPRPMTF